MTVVTAGETTGRLLTEHCGKYPALQIRDIFKFLHQSSFGCEHLITSPDKVTEYIRQEFAECQEYTEKMIEPLDGPYSRVHLGWLRQGLSAETLGKLFFLSAKKEPDGIVALEQKLKTVRELISGGLLPFSPEEFISAAEEWKGRGYPAVRHSEIFRETYRPAYRVIAGEYIPFLPLLAEIDRLFETGSVKVETGTDDSGESLCLLLEKLYGGTACQSEAGKIFRIAGNGDRYSEISAAEYLSDENR